MFVNETEIRKVHGLNECQEELAKAFIKGAVYCWLKNNKDQPFSVRGLFGGINTNWEDTPLDSVWKKHINAGKNDDEAYDAARKDVGWLLKSVLNEDKNRKFSFKNQEMTNMYYWENRVDFEE